NGTHYQQTPGGKVWDFLSGGDGGDATVDTISLSGVDESLRYSSSQNLGGFRKTRWDANNNLLETSFPSTVVTSGSEFVPQFKTPVFGNNVAGGRLLFVGANGIYESLDQGDTMQQLTSSTSGFLQDAGDYGGSQGGIANPDAFYIAQRDDVFIRTSSGTVNQTDPNTSSSDDINDVVMNTNDWSNAFAVDDTSVYQTTDSGGTWADITGSLAAIAGERLQTIAFVSGAVSALVVGASQGVFVSRIDALGTWAEVGSNLPNALVYDLIYNAVDDVLLAGMLGRGAWTFENASELLAGAGSAMPEINVQGGTPAIDIADGDVTPDAAEGTDFGQAFTGAPPVSSHQFTIENTGADLLTISAINISGADASDFSVTGFVSGTISAGGSETFSLEFAPSADGVRSATIEIVNDDADENPYNFDVTGEGIPQADLTVSIADGTISEADGAAATTVTITRGTDTTNELDVILSSSDRSEATIQTMATIPAGMTSVTVDLDAIDDTAADGTQNVTIIASVDGGVADGTAGVDTSFGTSGQVTTQLNMSDSNSIGPLGGIAVQTDGKIVVASQGFNANQFLLERLNADGTSDASFGTNGLVFTSVGANTSPTSIAIQEDGKILVAGETSDNGRTPFLARFNVDGTIDTTYGTSGLVDFSSIRSSGIVDIGLNSDGQVLAALENFGAAQMHVLRFNSEGTFDSSFGTGGLKSFWEFGAMSASIEVLPNDQFLLVGNSNEWSTVIRAFPDGTLDTSFGTIGSTRIQFDNDSGPIFSMSVDEDGRIALGGSAFNNTTRNDFAIALLTPQGLLDTNFGGDGMVVVSLPPGEDEYVDSLAFQPDGKIIAVGVLDRFNPIQNQIAMTRFNADGTLDTTFDGDGILTFSVGNSSNQRAFGTAIASDSDLLILAGGGSDIRVARVNTGLTQLQASDSVSITDNDGAATFDFGDAPNLTQSGFASSYPVSLADDGARHTVGGPRFGGFAQAELDGVNSADATFDDGNGSDDENGVKLLSPVLFASSTSASTGSVSIELSNADPTSNRLDAWIDFNRDGDWDDAGEQIVTNFDLGTIDGTYVVDFAVPQDTGTNIENGFSYARFRVSTAGGLGVTGAAADGEVEDHQVVIVTADSIVVDTNSDTVDGDYSTNNLSLREAIDLANHRSGVDTITFDASLHGGTITLAIEQLAIADDLTLTGLGASTLAIDANNAFRVFDLPESKDVTIDGLTLTNGRTMAAGFRGGAIRSTGNFQLRNSVVSGSSTTGAAAEGGGISQFEGSLTVANSTITGNATAASNVSGGGIAATNANVIISRSTIHANTTTDAAAAGIYALGSELTMTDSTVSNNVAGGASSVTGGVLVINGNLMIDSSTISSNRSADFGGGLLFASAGLTGVVTNSTISGNVSTNADGGGVFVYDGTFNINHSTITRNSGTAGSGVTGFNNGAGVAANINVLSSIIADNTGDDVGNTGGGGNTFTSFGFNLIGSGNATPGFLQITDQTGVSAGLDSLANNGGMTQTHALLPDSLAINAGDTSSTQVSDQRGAGFPRVVGSNTDVGAFELQSTNPSVTLSLDSASIPEAAGVATFTATLSEITGEVVTINLGFSGTATLTDDYTRGANSIVIPAGSLTGTVKVTAVQDGVDDDSETIIVDIDSVTGGTENGTQQQTTTIVDDDNPPAIRETTVGLNGSNDLLIQDTNGGTSNDTLTISINGANIRVYDPNNTLAAGTGANEVDANTVEIPITSLVGGGGIIVDSLGGDDTLTVDYSGGLFTEQITFDGGGQTTNGDALILTGGGTFSDVTFNYTNNSDGSIEITGTSTITYTGLEPITSNVNATDVMLNYSTTAETISVTDAGSGQTTVDSNVGGEATTFNNPSGTLTVNAGDTGVNVINVGGLAASYPANISIVGGDGGDTVNLNGTVALAVDKSLTVNALSINIPNSTSDIVSSGFGQVTLVASGGITMSSGSSISTVDGGVNISANVAGTTTGDFVGLALSDADITTSGGGAISLSGIGGTTADNHGIVVDGGSVISSTQTSTGGGAIILVGQAGAGVGADGLRLDGVGTEVTSQVGIVLINGVTLADDGVVITNNAAVRSLGTTADGASLSIQGTGGSVGGVNGSEGVVIGNSAIVTSINGDIEIIGENLSGFHGVRLFNAAAVTSTGTTVDAAQIHIAGLAGGVGADGVQLHDASTRIEADAGAINIDGDGSSGEFGVNLFDSATIQVATGTMSILGTGGTHSGVRLSDSSSGNLISIGSGDIDIFALSSDIVVGGGSVIGGPLATGNLTLTADELSFVGGAIQSTGDLILEPLTASRNIQLGGSTGASLSLTDAELGILVDGFNSITIGDLVNGTGTVDIDTITLNDPVTITGSTISDNAGTDITAPTVNLIGDVSPGQSPGILTVVGDFTFANNDIYTVEIGGIAPGDASNNHDQVNVTGTVTISSNVTLITGTFNGFSPSPGNSFTIIRNDGTDAVTGTFAGLAEGATIEDFLGSGLEATISYVGGSGNDVVLNLESNSTI
ncbi:hypothetical protein RMSM_06269, partial [Rhodopirellula maiorica SM1]